MDPTSSTKLRRNSLSIMYQSDRSFNIPPGIPGHLMPFPVREGGNLMSLVFSGDGAFDHHLQGVRNGPFHG